MLGFEWTEYSFQMTVPLSINAVLFKAYVHPDCIIVNCTRLELASGGKLPDLVFWVGSFEEHVLKGPFR